MYFYGQIIDIIIFAYNLYIHSIANMIDPEWSTFFCNVTFLKV